jgi:quinoprotein glucose dehydrogenase
VLYVRSADQPAMHILREFGTGQNFEGSTPEQRGRSAFVQLCEMCNGQVEANGFKSMDRTSIISVEELGPDRFRETIRGGQGQMPAFSESTLSAQNLDALFSYLTNPAAGARPGDRSGRSGLPPHPLLRQRESLATLDGWVRCCIPRMASLRSVLRGRRSSRMISTRGQIGSWGDRTVHAYDKDNGKLLWEKQLEANPEEIPAVYEAGGRQYVVFCASGIAPPKTPPVVETIDSIPGKIEAQGYYVFTLPRTTSAVRK